MTQYRFGSPKTPFDHSFRATSSGRVRWVQSKPNLSYTFCQIFAYYDVAGGGVQNCKACLQFQVLLSSSEIANLAKERVYIWHQNHFAQQKIVSLEWARMSPRV